MAKTSSNKNSVNFFSSTNKTLSALASAKTSTTSTKTGTTSTTDKTGTSTKTTTPTTTIKKSSSGGGGGSTVTTPAQQTYTPVYNKNADGTVGGNLLGFKDSSGTFIPKESAVTQGGTYRPDLVKPITSTKEGVSQVVGFTNASGSGSTNIVNQGDKTYYNVSSPSGRILNQYSTINSNNSFGYVNSLGQGMSYDPLKAIGKGLNSSSNYNNNGRNFRFGDFRNSISGGTYIDGKSFYNTSDNSNTQTGEEDKKTREEKLDEKWNEFVVNPVLEVKKDVEDIFNEYLWDSIGNLGYASVDMGRNIYNIVGDRLGFSKQNSVRDITDEPEWETNLRENIGRPISYSNEVMEKWKNHIGYNENLNPLAQRGVPELFDKAGNLVMFVNPWTGGAMKATGATGYELRSPSTEPYNGSAFFGTVDISDMPRWQRVGIKATEGAVEGAVYHYLLKYGAEALEKAGVPKNIIKAVGNKMYGDYLFIEFSDKEIVPE